MYRARYTFYNVLLNSIALMEYLASYYTTFRNTHYEKFPLLEYIARKVEVFEYIVRPDLMCACSSYRLPLPDISLILPWQIQITVILTL
jgi:hypothetical protein